MKYIKYIIPIIMLSLVLLSCAKKEEKKLLLMFILVQEPVLGVGQQLVV